MFAVMGITGNIGGEVARRLLAADKTVRGVVRDSAKASPWARRGCEITVADINDPAALSAAFRGMEGVFVLVPPNFDPLPGFPEAQKIAASLRSAIEAARPGRVVYVSTIGAQATQSNLLSQHSLIEQALAGAPTPIAFLRPGWFMENFRWDVAPAITEGVFRSFLYSIEKPFPMVATADVGRVAAELLQETWTGHRVVELEGPRRLTPSDVAATFTNLLGMPVKMEIVPREAWEKLFRSQGMKNPEPRIRMLDGFNEGWIDFPGGEAGSRKGSVELKTVLKALIDGEGR